jgi:threonine dehydrogenase-like Zn-dependent dehydrogenase
MRSKVVLQVGDRALEMTEREIPPVGADEGLLRVEACGLCGSDVEQYRGRFTEKGLVRYPLIPGHEPIGVIEEIGPVARAAWGVKIGDRIALEPHLACGRCPTCLGGAYHLCKTLLAVAAPSYGYLPLDFGHGLWGGYSEYIHLHPRTIAHKLPVNLPTDLATMYQAIAAGIRWAVHVPKTAFSDTVLILGCGQRGLGAVLACRAAGVGCIIVTGLARDRHKLDLAERLGAHHTIVSDAEDALPRIMTITSGRGVDVALDVVPTATEPVSLAVEAVRMGGMIVLAGIKGGRTMAAIDTDRIVYKEITLRGVFTQGSDAYEQAIDMLARDGDRIAPMKTHAFPLARAENAILTLAGEVPGEEAICVSINPGRTG